MEQFMKSCLIIAFLSGVILLQFGAAEADYMEEQMQFWSTMLPNSAMPESVVATLAESGKDQGIGAILPPSLKDDNAGSYLLEKDLIVPGTKIDIHYKCNLRGSRFPSPQLAQKLPPLIPENLNQLLLIFGVSPGSDAAEIISKALVKCQEPEPFKGGVQFCASSLEEMVTLVTSNFVEPLHVRAASMPAFRATKNSVVYEITGAIMIGEDSTLLGCHKWNFPVGLYYCHVPRGTTAYAVSLVEVDTGVRVRAYATCHEHFSAWFTSDLFQKLNVTKGNKACHINHLNDVIWYKT